MCFTAGASFTASAVLATAGTATLREVRSQRELLLAMFPVVFSVHQLIEGVLWLTIGRGPLRHLVQWLTVSYLVVAYCVWPMLSPAALYLIEPDANKKKRFVPLLVLGVILSLYLLCYTLLGQVGASIVHCSIAYSTDIPYADQTTVLYAIVVLLPFFFSSYRPILALGVMNLILCSVTYYIDYVTFDSVWCFVAAALSINIYLFFRWLHRGQFQSVVPSGVVNEQLQ